MILNLWLHPNLDLSRPMQTPWYHMHTSWLSHTHPMNITYTPQGYYMHTNWLSHAHLMSITCTIIIWKSHAQPMNITYTTHEYCMHNKQVSHDQKRATYRCRKWLVMVYLCLHSQLGLLQLPPQCHSKSQGTRSQYWIYPLMCPLPEYGFHRERCNTLNIYQRFQEQDST